MRHPSALVAAAVLLLLAPLAAAQETFSSLAGPWWFTIGGKDKGSIVLQFSDPNGGTFEVEDVTLTEHESFGFARSLEGFFTITAGEDELGFDPERNIVGNLTLSLVNGGTATLSIEKGNTDKTFTVMKLRATLDGVKVKLKGKRPPAAFPVLTGETNAGSLKGKGVKSKAMDLLVQTSSLGPPSYQWTSEGPALIDGADDTASLAGQIMLTPSFKAFGVIDSDFGDGLVTGKLRLPDPNSPVPKFGIKAEATEPIVTVKGQLTIAVDPVLQVTPLSFDFGAVKLNDPNAPTHTFTVQNVGSGDLGGKVKRLSGSTDFEIVGDDTYGPLAAGDEPAEIEIAFTPTVAGEKTAQFRFGVDGGAGSVLVNVTGTGGVAEITTDPADEVAFGTVAPGSTLTRDIKVINDGDATLTGAATLGTSTPPLSFELVGDLGVAQTSIPYSVPAGGNAKITVRFKPTDTTAASGSVNFSGGAGTSVNLTGNQ